MKTFINGQCTANNLYSLVDPSIFTEEEFEMHCFVALQCIYSDYHLIQFRGGFAFDENVHEADLALVHKSYSHWFVLEVELASHSLHHHVLPQIRSFRFGKPQESCIAYLTRHIPHFEVERAYSLLQLVPRGVAVVVNRYDDTWSNALAGCDAQLLTVSVFKRHDGQIAYETHGLLYVPQVSLGFFRYLAPERSMRLPHGVDFAEGEMQFQDPYGAYRIWVVRHSTDSIWITKKVGDPGIPHNSLVQILKTHTGRFTIRIPS